jgi:hypothetical protein
MIPGSAEAAVASTAAGYLSGRIDPLTALRRVFTILGDVDRLDDRDVKTMHQIFQETLHLPDPEHRGLWDPAALPAKDLEIDACFQRLGPKLREACEHIVAKWAR